MYVLGECVYWGILSPRDHRPFPPARALRQMSCVLTTKMAGIKILNYHQILGYSSLLRKEEQFYVPQHGSVRTRW